MKFFLKSIVFIFLLLSATFLHAQDTTKIIKAKRNALKIGVSAIPTKLFFSYEHAFTKHISLGGMVSYGGTTFVGYSATIFTRYYFGKFNESGWFVEARGSYAHFNPYAYTSSHKSTQYTEYYLEYDGKHKANIDYWNAGISAGYKVFFHEYGRGFFEFIAGVHNGNATFGKNDLLLGNGNSLFGNDDLQDAFNRTGPGFPLHFLINYGFSF